MHPKKSLSQNFLCDQTIIQNIAEEATSSETILEIGAGEGVLTDELAKRAKKIIALEFDRDLIPELLNRFPLSSNVSVVEADILRTDIPGTLKKYGWKGESYDVFGNIPYAITGKIIRLLVALDPAPRKIVLMIQKEVADRIVARDGKQSVLSTAVALFGKAEKLFDVSRNAFRPAPNVESAILCIVPDVNRLPVETREHILRVVKIGFASRRKTLANNLATLPEYSKDDIEDLLASLSLSKNVRAEELPVGVWKKLYEQVLHLKIECTVKIIDKK